MSARASKKLRRARKSARESACSSHASQCFVRAASCRRGLRQRSSVVAAARQSFAEHRGGSLTSGTQAPYRPVPYRESVRPPAREEIQ